MTCIVGLEKSGTVWMGGDSAGTAGNMHQRVRGDKKVFIKGEFIIGFCGSFRMGQLLQYSLVLPEQPEGKGDFEFLVTDFIDALKVCLKPKPGEEKQEQQLTITDLLKRGHRADEDDLSPSFLFGYRGHLYGVQGDYQITKPEEGFDAMGSGADIAVGAMHASVKTWQNPRKRLTQALDASAKNNAAVRPPFTILSLKKGR